MAATASPTPFTNEPFTDFSRDTERAAMQEALRLVHSQFGKRYQLIIGGERYSATEYFQSVNPARKGEVIGYFCKTGKEQAEQAVQAALKAFEGWSGVDPSRRADVLFKAAAIMRRRKHELAAWLIYEVGKTWAEADADVAEAIDFCEFYAREMLRLAGAAAGAPASPGERNELHYIPLGVGVVIPPWNFPLAILCGMTVAALVTGNTVVLKPSQRRADHRGYKFVEVLEEAGLPPRAS